MSINIAVTGKSGSGKTTITKGLLRLLQGFFPEKSILLFDNDLASELTHSFGLDVRNTIYGIRTGKHEYKTGIPSKMTKQEYIEWALEDIIVNVEPNIDIIVSWLIGTKNCRCPITTQLSDALKKLVARYDFVIFDCEFDLKYLNQLFDVQMDVTLIIARAVENSVTLAKRIEEFSAKYAANGQIGVILNCVDSNKIEHIYELLEKNNLKTLGVIPFDENLKLNTLTYNSTVVTNSLKDFYFRLNLPQVRGGE